MYLQKLEKCIEYEHASIYQKLAAKPFHTQKMVIARLIRKLSTKYNFSIPATAKLFTGQNLNVFLPEDISTAIYCYGFFEENLSRIILDRLKPGMIFFDIGAHVGYYSKIASLLVGESGQVHGFEPTPSTFQVLASNFVNSANVFLNNLAVWSEETSLTLSDYGRQFAGLNSFTDPRISPKNHPQQANYLQNFKTQFQISAISIDSYINATSIKPDLIKIDAESAEYKILLGMENTLQQIRPQIILEVGDLEIEGASSSSKLIQHLLERNYQPYTCRTGKLELHQPKAIYQAENLIFIPN